MKTTYILGAGASAKALPTVKADPNNKGNKGLAQSLVKLAKHLQNDSTIVDDHAEFKNTLINNLKWLSEGSNQFGTTDTFAKFLYLQPGNNFEELKKLKETLIVFFLIEQFINKKVDQRPLIFLTTVMQKGWAFPDEIKIINWNFDFQIQIAAEVFRKESFIVEDSGSVHSPPLIGYYPSYGFPTDIQPNDISMVHMNGIAGFYHSTTASMQLSYFANAYPQDLNSLLSAIKADPGNKTNLLTFAWEKGFILSDKAKYAKALIADTEILVVIGYSFPFFNRELDKEIFSELLKGDVLKKIYYQDPYRKGDFLRAQFGIDPKVLIENVSNGDNYFVPLEL